MTDYGTQQTRISAAIATFASQLPWRTSALARRAKRAIDLVIAIPASLAAVPVAGTVALLVRATSKGPVLLRQTRVGLDGQLFTMWKFRTMLAHDSTGFAAGRSEVTREDPRLTPIGRVLRDWRLDELPQLAHVLAGQMSLVGPRPDLPENVPHYAEEHLIRFAMPPGCTAWTFTRGAFANDWSTRQAINAEYVKAWSWTLDLRVLLGTVGVLLAQRNTSPDQATRPEGQR
ncbi:MAG TPA: sugar transferase [Kofleriaceae bacterium]|nr:sugar transferase [Kofleriaceae bacterium]